MSISLVRPVLVVLVVSALSTVPVEGVAGDNAEQIEVLVQAYHDAGVLNGTVLVVESGKPIVEAGYGLANREWGVPNTPETKFLIGSATKQFTAILTLQLVDRGLLSLNGTVAEYLPEYREDTGGQITISHLLTHTSGLPDYFDRDFYENHKHRKYPKAQFLDRFLSPDLRHAPGSQPAYSSVNYYLLGLIVQRVTGKPYDQVLRESILDPLGMSDTGFNRHAVVKPGLASGYIKNLLGFWTPPFEVSESSAFSAGAMYSTVRDLRKFDESLHGDALLPDHLLRLVLTPSGKVSWMENTHFAHGGMVSHETLAPSGEPRVVHQMAGNTTTGFTTILTRIPEDRHFVAIVTNAGPGYMNDALHELNRGILAILYGGEYTIPSVPPEERLGQAILTLGIEAALGDLERHESDGVSISERGMNLLGYQLLEADRTPDALIIFQLNVDRHPESANAHDSLAEASLRAGDRARAMENYRKALELDGDGRVGKNAEEQLRRLQM